MMKTLSELTPGSREPEWSEALAKEMNARAEERTLYGSRCDIVTDVYAVEVERAGKWQEAIGQAWYYASVLGRKPAVLLLIEDKEKEQLNIGRCAIACAGARVPLAYIDMNDPEANLDEVIEILCPGRAAERRLQIGAEELLKQASETGRYFSTH